MAGLAAASSASAETATFGMVRKYCIATDAKPAAILAATDADGFTAAPPDLAKTMESSPFQHGQMRTKQVGDKLVMVMFGSMNAPSELANLTMDVCAVVTPLVEAGAANDVKGWAAVPPAPRDPDEITDTFIYAEGSTGHRSVIGMKDADALRLVRTGAVHLISSIGGDHQTAILFGAVRGTP